MLLSSAFTPLPLYVFDDDWRVQERRLNSNQALAALAERGYEMRCVGERRAAVRRNPITVSPLSERVRQGATPPPRRRQDRKIPAVSCPLHMLRRRVAAQTSASMGALLQYQMPADVRCGSSAAIRHGATYHGRHRGQRLRASSPDKTCPGEPDGGRNDKHHQQNSDCEADIHAYVTRFPGLTFSDHVARRFTRSPRWRGRAMSVAR